MKSKITTILVLSMLLTSCIVSKNAPLFKDYGEVDNNHCVLYIIRGSSMYGSAVPWSVMIKRYDLLTRKFEYGLQIDKVYQKSYTPILLSSNTLYSITFGSTTFLFSGTPNSQSIFKLTGFKTQTAAIKGNSLIRSNSESGFNFNNEQINDWAIAIKKKVSYTNLSVKKSLLDAEFEILVPQNNSLLFREIKTLRISGE